MDKVIWRFRKAWSRSIGGDSGLSAATRLIALLEIIFSATFVCVLFGRPVDWQTFWPPELVNADQPMPWGHWFAAYLVTTTLVCHGVYVLQKKRWALVGLGAISLVAMAAPFILAAARISEGVSAGISTPFLGWLFLLWSPVKEGYRALTAKPDAQTSKVAKLEAPAPPTWIA